MPRLRWPRRRHAGVGPAITGRDERWALARLLLHQDGLAAADRVAGCLILIYGQRPARVARLTVDDVLPPAEGEQTPVRVRLGATPIEVPEPLTGHLRSLLTARRGPTTAAVTSCWLFPSPSAPGQPLRPRALGKRLARLGLAPEKNRSAALLDLSTQMPPVVLADVLGISVATAEHWASLAGRDRAAYLNLS